MKIVGQQSRVALAGLPTSFIGSRCFENEGPALILQIRGLIPPVEENFELRELKPNAHKLFNLITERMAAGNV